MKLTGINIYPVKSLKGISLTHSVVEGRGLKYDRRWMVVNKDNTFLTQREYPEMTLIEVQLSEEVLTLAKKGFGSVNVGFEGVYGNKVRTQMFKDFPEGLELKGEVNDWLSAILGISCRLVFMNSSIERPVDREYDKWNNTVSYADAYPFLLIGQGSLDELNNRLEEPIPMKRFRPNLVIDSKIPFVEESWKEIRIGECKFRVVKPCARCMVTTIDPETGKVGKEPLRTLSTFRNADNKVLFGQNLLYAGGGNETRIGDEVVVEK